MEKKIDFLAILQSPKNIGNSKPMSKDSCQINFCFRNITLFPLLKSFQNMNFSSKYLLLEFVGKRVRSCQLRTMNYNFFREIFFLILLVVKNVFFVFCGRMIAPKKKTKKILFKDKKPWFIYNSQNAFKDSVDAGIGSDKEWNAFSFFF